MRALAEDPWDRTMAEVGVGSVVRGTVVRLQPFGAFVEIVPGVEGLLHVSAFGRRIAQPSDVVSVGESIAVQVDEVDGARRRISLSYVDPADLVEPPVEEPLQAPGPVEKAAPLPQPKPVIMAASSAPANAAGLRVRRSDKPAPAEVPTPKAAAVASSSGDAKPRVLSRTTPSTQTPTTARTGPDVGQVVDVTVDKVEPFGLLVKWATHRGLIPSAEVELPKGADLKKAFPLGTALKAAITEVRDGRIRLSVKAAAQAEERAEAQSWMRSQSGPKTGFGTLGDLLKGKIG
jgi:small subunit ribosomal protein S1